ncbi:hypothetical protein D3C81_2244650 [compost metagenome]
MRAHGGHGIHTGQTASHRIHSILQATSAEPGEAVDGKLGYAQSLKLQGDALSFFGRFEIGEDAFF